MWLLTFVSIFGTLCCCLSLSEYKYCPQLAQAANSLCEIPTYAKFCPISCQNHTLKCYSCADINNPSHCHVVSTCKKSEVCVVTQSINSNFGLTYESGCIPKEKCSLFVKDDISPQRSAVLPGGCCYTSKCNRHRPHDMHKNRLTCFACNETKHPELCSAKKTCANNQLCVVTESLSSTFDLVYRTGCMDRHECDAFIHNGIGRHHRSTVRSGDCCEHNLCNKYIPNAPVSSAHNHLCVDVNSPACSLIKRDVYRNDNKDICSEDNTFRHVFCPHSCHTCFNCYNCTTNDESVQCPRHEVVRCEANQQTCILETSPLGAIRRCGNTADCHKTNNYCCRSERCNTNYPTTTTKATTKPIKTSTSTRTTAPRSTMSSSSISATKATIESSTTVHATSDSSTTITLTPIITTDSTLPSSTIPISTAMSSSSPSTLKSTTESSTKFLSTTDHATSDSSSITTSTPIVNTDSTLQSSTALISTNITKTDSSTVSPLISTDSTTMTSHKDSTTTAGLFTIPQSSTPRTSGHYTSPTPATTTRLLLTIGTVIQPPHLVTIPNRRSVIMQKTPYQKHDKVNNQ